ncbi:MAG: hypothetical protein IIV56_05380, partial [Mailhella sp.]|nr:hypothetical protein [Mailhella sp.]
LSAAILAVAGLALVIVDVYPFVREYAPAEWTAAIEAYIPAALLPWVNALEGTMYVGAVLIVTAVILLSLTRLALPGGALLVTAMGMMLMLQPYHWFVAPSVTALLTPSAQAAAKAEPAAPAVEAVPAAPEAPAPAEPAPAAPEAPAPAEPAPAEAPAAPAPEAAPAEKAPEAQPEAAPAAEAPAEVKA